MITKEKTWISFFVFAAVFCVYLNTRISYISDPKWSIPIAMSIIQEGNTSLDEYTELKVAQQQYAIETFFNHTYSIYPVGVSVLAIPWVYCFDAISSLALTNHSAFFSSQKFQSTTIFLKRNYRRWGIPGLSVYMEPWVYTTNIIFPYILKNSNGIPQPRRSLLRTAVSKEIPIDIEKWVASFYTALAMAVFFIFAARYLSMGRAIIATALFAFGTSAWSTCTTALWQHGPSMLMLAGAILIILSARENESRIQFLSLPLAAAFVIRPTNGLSVALGTVYVLLCHRKYFLQYLLWSLPIAIPFLAYNLSVYHAFFSPYYQSKLFSNLNPWEGLLGTWVSPGRGLLVYSPVLFFIFWGIQLKIRQKEFKPYDALFLLIMVFHWISISVWNSWWGGSCYGPRMLSDILPFAFYFLIPAVKQLDFKTMQQKIITGLFIFLALASILMNAWGANSAKHLTWQLAPEHEQLWNWSDPPFMHGLKRARH